LQRTSLRSPLKPRLGGTRQLPPHRPLKGHAIPDFIPVFLVEVDASVDAPPPLDRVQDLVADGLGAGTVFQSVSSNWWHQALTQSLQAALGLSGLTFLSSDIVLLRAPEVVAAGSTAQALKSALQARVIAPASVSADFAVLSDVDLSSELAAATPTLVLEPEADIGPLAARGYCVYLQSLIAFVEHARSHGTHLIHYAPRP